DVLLESVQEISLGTRAHVQAVRNAVAGDVVQQRFLALGVVVAIVQRTGASQKVDVASAVGIVEGGAFGAVKNDGEGSGIRTDIRFQFFEGDHEMFPLSVLVRGGRTATRL